MTALSIPAAGRYAPLDLTPSKLKQKTLQANVVQIEGLAARWLADPARDRW